MDWFKKYYEKLFLAASLLLLIAVAGYLALKINRLGDEIHNSLASSSLPSIPAVDLAPYSNAITALQSPSLWTNGNAVVLFPPRPVAPVIVNITPTTVETQGVIRLVSVTHRPFQLLFMHYRADEKEKGVGSDFQVNFRNQNRTFFVKRVGDKIADAYTDTGYVITNFEQKIVEKDNPSVGGKISHDLSLLTVQHEGEPAIVLVHGRVANHPRRYARIQRPDNREPLDLAIGETFASSGNTYKVVDIGEKEVVLLNTISNKKQALFLVAP